MTIANLISNIEQSKSKRGEGTKLAQQSVENYISEILDMDIIESENLGDENSYKDVMRVVAKSRKEGIDSTYTFLSEHYTFDEFTPRGDSITLNKIEGEAGVHEIEQTFYMTTHSDEFNKKHKLLNTPLSEIISGEIKDTELSFVINSLKDRFKGKKGYEYTEEQKGNIKTFSITLDKDIKMYTGMSNTIQVSFEGKRFQAIQVIYRDKPQEEIVEELEKLSNFVEEYFKWDIKVDGEHSLTEIYDYLDSKRLLQDVVTSLLLKGEDVNYVKLFQNIVIGGWDSYNQAEVVINYNYKDSKFELVVNHLFKEVKVICDGVQQVKDMIDNIISLLK